MWLGGLNGTKIDMCMFRMTKTPLINANLVPLAFGANGAALLAPARALGSCARALCAIAHAPALLAASRNVHSHKNVQIVYNKLHYYKPWHI
jgi:hypothetical protein